MASGSALKDENGQAASEATPTRVMIIINQESSIKSSIIFLTHHGYQVQIAHSFGEAVGLLETFKPEVVMVSWNLKRTDVRKVYKLLTERLHLPCIVFSEDAGMKSSLTLMNSGIHNHIIAPVSGGTIHTKIDSVLHPEKHKKEENHFNQEKIVVVQPDDVPGGALWEKVNSSKVSVGENIVWRGTYHDVGSQTKKVFYFKGPVQPVYDETEEKWTGLDQSRGPIIMQERPQSEEFSEIQKAMEGQLVEMLQKAEASKEYQALMRGKGPAANPQFDWKNAMVEIKKTMPLIETEDEESEKKSTAPSQSRSFEKELIELKAAPEKLSLLAAIVKEVLSEQCVGHDGAELYELTKVRQVTALVISSPRFKGYLYFAQATDPIDKELMNVIAQEIAKKMSQKGEILGEPTDIFELNVHDISFISYTEMKGEFTLSIQNESHQLACSFFSVPQIPRLLEAHTDEAKQSDLLAIELEKNFVADWEIPFDLYLDMEKNHRIILYLKAGSLLCEKTYEKLLHFHVKEVYVKSQEREHFLGYCAKVRFLKD